MNKVLAIVVIVVVVAAAVVYLNALKGEGESNSDYGNSSLEPVSAGASEEGDFVYTAGVEQLTVGETVQENSEHEPDSSLEDLIG